MVNLVAGDGYACQRSPRRNEGHTITCIATRTTTPARGGEVGGRFLRVGQYEPPGFASLRGRAKLLGKNRGCMPHRFVRIKHRHQREQAQARCIAINAMRVDQRLAQHLQPTTHPQHRPALLRMLRNRRIQSLRAQPSQVSTGVLGTRQDDPIRRLEARQFRRATDPLQAQARNVLERLKLVQITDARIGHHRHRHVYSPLGHTAVVKHAVFLGQAMLPPHGQGGHRGNAGQVLQHLRCGRQQGGIAPELVEYKTLDQPPLVLGQQGPGAIQMGKCTTAVNVRHKKAGRIAMFGDPHVHNVTARQIDLGGRARALNHHHIVLGPQRIQRRRNLWPDLEAAAAPRHGAQLRTHLPHQHHLAVRVTLGLEQQRVHPHIGHGVGSQGLEVLGRANFSLAVV